MRKLITICVIAGLMLAVSPVAMGVITVDADAYPVGTLLNNAYPGVTLTALGPATGGDTRVLAYYHPDASTGTNVFGDPGETANPTTWGDGNWDYLRADFAVDATWVALDFITDNAGDKNAELLAYDSGGILVASAGPTDVPGPAGTFVTLQVSAPNIAYVLAYWDNINRVEHGVLDNLQFQPIPAPGAILLGSLGVAVVGWLRRRRTL